MKSGMWKKIISNWYLVLAAGFLVFAGLVLIICGEDSIIAVHDNLDLFIPQLQMMKDTGSFWTHDTYVPFLGGISRDALFSEFSLYTILYMIFPAYPAYVAGYLLKILIAIFSCLFLGKDFCGESYGQYKPLIWLTGFAYGILNVFPAFGISFASIPLVICLVRKIYKTPSVKWYLALFFYPMLSYFSYFGLFILAYMVAALLWLWVRDKRFPARLLLAAAVLSLGYVIWEYRLFGMMLFGEEETIRSSIVVGSYSFQEIIRTMLEGFTGGMFHAESLHAYLVMPVCMVYFVYLNVSYFRNKNGKGIFRDVYNLLMLVLVFNSAVYGIYYWEPFRNLVETVCPPLTGWQFNRTIFFNPFVWYGAFFLALMRLYRGKKGKIAANALAVLAILIIVFTGSRYNDLYHTCYDQAYRLVKGKAGDQLSFGEFYSRELFEEAKEDIGYLGQWSAAYGFYPATLEYNGISTLDGYLGFYAESYKDEFRKVIAPALERVEESRIYFDEWGARAYLYSGTDLSIVSTTKSYPVSDQPLYMDTDAFKALGGRYLFSRIRLTNAKEAGFTLIGTYTNESSPYTLYVYQTTSRYQTKEHSHMTYSRMQDLTYDREKLEREMDELLALAKEASESEEVLPEGRERVLELYESVIEEYSKLNTSRSLVQIAYYKNVLDEENGIRQQEITEEAVDLGDALYSTLKAVSLSPYREAMETVMEPELVESFTLYEEMTDEEKELYMKENSLEQEYELAAQEDYYFEYEGEEWNFARFMEEGESLSGDAYIDIYQGINREKNSVLGEIYLELVDIRTQRAKLEGYEDFGEFAYNEMYVRDYSVDQAKELFTEIRKRVVPAVYDLKNKYQSMDFSPLYLMPETKAAQRLSLYRPYLEQVDPEMAETFDYMEKYGLYDMDPSWGKADTGFTIGLDYFNDAFIFDSPYGNYYDYTTAIHEFGHYHYMFRNAEDIMVKSNNIDLCEIHSQGLEMLFYDYYDEILGGEEGELFRFMEVYQMVDNIIESSLLSEFELEVYENPDMTLEDLNKLYLTLSQKYGIYYNDRMTELYTWVDIPHIFNSPCYYIGYATSAFTSLDILTLSEKDRHAAVEKYMEITTLPTYAAYCDAVEYVELRDIFEKGVPAQIIRETAEILR